ncbi:reverse transcriptase [Cucumis melo var. makuwa]|uniref:Reverse transcriptase n=1 Tax=Cucumis melo var. makuwa TaxID=1194695 RepID=A0A5D3C7K7_CUCMM|nr:reverse transcriptase [Cucumis melo var. makuwa]
MPSRVLHLQIPLECLKESYPSTRLISNVPLRVFRCTTYVHNHGPNPFKLTPWAQACDFTGYPLHQRGYKCFHLYSRKDFVSMDVTFLEDHPFFPVSHLQGESMTDSIDSHIDSKMNESDKSETIIPENIDEQGNVNTEVILDGKGSNDENKVSARVMQNEIREDRSENLSQLDPSLYLPIALRKGTRFCTKHFIANYLSFENLSPQFIAFTANLDSTVILKNIHIVLDCPEWNNVVMEEMRALEKNKTLEISGLPRSGST